MKTYFSARILFLIFALSIIAKAQTSNIPAYSINIDKAIQTLTSTKPVVFPTIELAAIDPMKQKAAQVLYTEQMNAISAIGAAKLSGTATYLIPYLNYSTRDYHGASFNGRPTLPENVNQTHKLWPAFSAILNIPHSSKDLASYALDTNNQINFRLAAFSALRYSDTNQFYQVAKNLSIEFPVGKNQDVIKSYLSNNIPFSGTIINVE